MTDSSFPIDWVRSQFPALQQDSIFADNAAGTQLPQSALNSMNDYLVNGYSLGGSTYDASHAADKLTSDVRESFRSFLNAPSEKDIHFGINATNLLRLLATSMWDMFNEGDEIVLTALDHEANITPWLRLQNKGVKIHYWKPRGPERMLATGDLLTMLGKKTRYVMVTGASNVLGTLSDLKKISEMAHAENARVIVDAVHMAPHGLIDVQDLGVDALIASGYKLFGPKLGFMYIKNDFFKQLPSLNHYFLDSGQFEIGAPNYEAMAGFRGVFNYFDELTKKCGLSGFEKAIEATDQHERALTKRMLAGIEANKKLVLHGITSELNLKWRLPTFALRHTELLPAEMAEKLAAERIHCRHGHMYAPRLIESLKLRSTAGVCRLSLSHYNTFDEVDRILKVLELM